ncbi:MAG: SigE family RNA polymerase sigma factor [Acidimicrobiales bacterium]
MDGRALDGTQASFDHFVRASTDQLLGTGYLIVWDLYTAQDLVQETLVRVALRWGRVSRMEHPSAYARRVLVNLALDHQRRRARSKEDLGPLSDDGTIDLVAAGDPFGQVEDREVLLLVLARLPIRQRTTLVLRFWADLPDAEIAFAMGCSIGSVKSQASRGLDRLRDMFGPQDNEMKGDSALWISLATS